MKTLKLIAMLAVLMLIASTAIAKTATVSYTDSYRWHGFPTFPNDYIHPGVATNINGIDVKAVTHIGEAHDDIEYWDTQIGYKLPIDGLNVSASYGYFLLPGVDAQELAVTIGLPGAIAPRYTVAQVWLDDGENGQIHEIGVDADIGDIGGFKAALAADITFNDGVLIDEADWTHATAGLIIDIPIGDNIALQPGVIYQHALEPDALGCEEDEVWFVAALTYRF